VDNKSIGALWKRTSKKGVQYFSGTLQMGNKPIQIVVFENGNKKEAKHPDYKILVSTPREAPEEETQEDPF
jgi:uncharacterized protein (DUF736 family)